MLGCGPTVLSFEIMQVCLEEGQDWFRRQKAYTYQNFLTFKQQCSKKLPKLFIYEMQSAYLMLVDFKDYTQDLDDLQKKMASVNVCPAFIGNNFGK